MTKKIYSTKLCGRKSKIYNGAFLKCFSILLRSLQFMLGWPNTWTLKTCRARANLNISGNPVYRGSILLKISVLTSKTLFIEIPFNVSLLTL